MLSILFLYSGQNKLMSSYGHSSNIRKCLLLMSVQLLSVRKYFVTLLKSLSNVFVKVKRFFFSLVNAEVSFELIIRNEDIIEFKP